MTQQHIRQFIRYSLWVALILAGSQVHAGNWPQWRGPDANGTAPGANPPLTWSETENVKWKVSIPGFGTSTPIVWEDNVFILTAIPAEEGAKPNKGLHQFAVLCLNRQDGNVRWQKTAREEAPHEGHHVDHGYASASPITDGKLLIAYFGSRGLHCYDFDGNLKWSKELGRMRTRNSFGEGASPALHGDIVVVNWDDENEEDFVAAFNKNTGERLWRTPRNEPTGWSTPLIVEHKGKHQVVVNATRNVRGYDLQSGKEVWSCGGQTANSIPSPVADKDTVYVTSGFRGSALYAIALGHTGELDGTDAIRWSRAKNTPYVPSPLLVDRLLYTITMNSGTLSCFDAKTGEPHFEGQRLEGVSGVYASPVSAQDRVYVLGRDGSCVVLKKGPTFEVIGRNKVQDRTDASLALVDGEVFIRGHRNLYCISEKK
jgi:outer membrane protein assembly factor BamB